MPDKRKPLKAKKVKSATPAMDAGASLKERLEGPAKKPSGGKAKR